MTTLRPLVDSDLGLADPAEDIRGHKVRDSEGEEIGEVDELLIDDPERRVRLLRVVLGGALGVRETKVLIPVDAITRIADNEVHITRTRAHVAGAPRSLRDLEDQQHLEMMYAYYGYYPYWRAGYVYPSYPVYR